MRSGITLITINAHSFVIPSIVTLYELIHYMMF
jgi:hypothetical protein